VDEEIYLPTPGGGGAAVLALCAEIARELAPGGAAVGIGLPEFVDCSGVPQSGVNVDWRGLDVAGAFAHIGAIRIAADVRAAARAEAVFGAGRDAPIFLYVSVGTGVSACLVVDGRPYEGAHGNAIVVGAPPVEGVASGRALSIAANGRRAEDVLIRPECRPDIESAAAALGRALATLVNALDPHAVVVGGGLGLAPVYLGLVEVALRDAVAIPGRQSRTVNPAGLGARAGMIGAALLAPLAA
jgi:glucokinase